MLDASLILSWYFEDEATLTEAILDEVSARGAVVPAPWRLEVANALQSALRRKRVTALYRDEALAELALLPITVESIPTPMPGRQSCASPTASR